MKQSREQKKAELMRHLESAVDELLDWEEQHERPTLTQIEDIVLEMRKQIWEEMANEVLARVGGKTVVPGPTCPNCGKEMRYKGEREKQIERRAGEVDLERSYYACPECEEGIFPPG